MARFDEFVGAEGVKERDQTAPQTTREKKN